MMFFWTLFSALVLTCYAADGLSDKNKEALKKLILPVTLQCIAHEGMSDELLENAEKLDNEPQQAAACLYACVLRGIDFLNADGKFDPKVAAEKLKAHVDIPQDMLMCEKALQACTSVNDVPVTDGDKGCERAMLLISCVRKQAKELNLDL